MKLPLQIKSRLKASAVHLLVSLLVASVVAAFVCGLWFPGVYRDLAGGTRLLTLIVVVDVTIGPLLTFAVFDQRKTRSHLSKDIATIAVLQLTALAYGLYTVQLARPVALVFEHDRFRVISAAEVLEKELPQALPAFRRLSWSGPRLMAVRKTVSGQERNETLFAAIVDGVDTSQRPSFWIPYDRTQAMAAWDAAQPMSRLLERYASDQVAILEDLGDIKLAPTEARFLPLVAREDAVVVLDRQGQVAGFIQKDGYF